MVGKSYQSHRKTAKTSKRPNIKNNNNNIKANGKERVWNENVAKPCNIRIYKIKGNRLNNNNNDNRNKREWKHETRKS